MLNASVNDITIDTATGTIQHFDAVYTNDPDQKLAAVADRFVLTLGGIENARILLNANRQVAKGIGNETGLRWSVFHGAYRGRRRPCFAQCTLADLFDQLTLDDRVGEAVSSR